MFITTVQPKAIDDRLAAESNAPDFADCARKLANCGMAVRRLGEIVTAPINNSVRNVADAYRDDDGTIPLFRPVDMKGAWLDPDSALRVSTEFESQHAKARVVPGNIVIAAAGTVARAAQVPVGVEYGAINGSCARVVVPDEVEGYVLSYFCSRYGFLSLMRWAVGSVQKHLNLVDLPRVLVPWPDDAVLRYIGDKVHRAERFRRTSRELSQSALLLVDLFLESIERASEIECLVRGLPACQSIPDSCLASVRTGSKSSSASHRRRSSRIPIEHLTTRLDCNFYAPEAIEFDKCLAGGYQLAALHEIVDPSRQITNGVRGPDLQPSPYKLVRLQDRDGWSIDFDRCLSISQTQFRENRRCELRERDVVVAIGGYIGHAAIARRVESAVIGQHSAVLPMGPNSSLDEGYLVAYLSSRTGAVHLHRYVSGTVQVGINLEDLRDVRVPIPGPEFQRHVGDLVRRADDLSYWSSRLCTLASRLVEGLVEERITENELVEARQSLERGDQALDRQILARMTKDGIDVANKPPLFADLNALYAAIEESQRSESSNGDAA